MSDRKHLADNSFTGSCHTRDEDTWREGRRVRTFSCSLSAATDTDVLGPPSIVQTPDALDGITHSSWLVSSISRIPITEEDAGFLTEDLHRGRSCVPPYNIPSRPVLVRWDPSAQVSPTPSTTADHS